MNKFKLLTSIVLFLSILPFTFAIVLVDNTSSTFSASAGQAQNTGQHFIVNLDGYTLMNATKSSIDTASAWALYNNTNGAYTKLIGGTFSGNVTSNIGILLLKGQNYFIMGDGNASHTEAYFTGAQRNQTVVNFTKSGYGTGNPPTVTNDSNNIRMWASLTFYKEDASSVNNFSITAKDFYTASSLTNFSATILGVNYTTTNGTINTNILSNHSSLIDINVSSTENGGYFNVTFTNYNVSNSLIANLTQSINVFTGYEKYTNNALSLMNFSTTYSTNVTHYMRAQTYNVSSNLSGYYVRTISYTPSATTTNAQNISYIYNATLNISAKEHYTNNAIENYTINLYNSQYAVNETYNVYQHIILNITNNINYTITFNKSNYFDNTTYSYQTNNATNFTIYTFKNNKLYLNFKDEETLLPISGVTYSLISAYESVNGTSSTSYIEIDNLSSYEYELRYYKNAYTPRSFFITIPLGDISLTNTTVYLLNTSSSSNFTLYVTDKYDLPQPDLLVSLLRRYAINGQTVYYTVAQMKPSYALSGQTLFDAVPNTIPYLFRVQNSNGDVVFQGSGLTVTNLETLYLIANPIYIRVQLESNPFTAVQDLEAVSYSLTNTSTAFWFSASDPDNILLQICLKVVANSTAVISNQCDSDTNSILSYTPTNTNANNTYYNAFGYFVTADGERIADVVTLDFRNDQGYVTYGVFGVFLALISIITISVAFADKPQFMVIGIAIVLLGLGSQALDIIWLSPVVQGTILIISIITAVLMREREY